MQRVFLKSFLFFLFLTVAVDVHASLISKLVDAPHRPTMLQVAEALNWDFRTNPPEFEVPDSTVLRYNVIHYGIPLLLQLEYSFPGATWAPLGRDVVVNGDFLDAFYLLRGEKDRVVRINASGSSFASFVRLINLFKTLKLVDETGLPIKNFVIFDYTRYGPQSQSARLLSELYSYIPTRRTLEFYSKVNLVTMYDNYRNIHPSLDIESFWRGMHCYSYADTRPSQILTVSNIGTYSDFWHDRFGVFQQTSEGKVFTVPGALSDRDTRIAILKKMIGIFRIVSSPEFAYQLSTYARNTYHLDFDRWLKGETQGGIIGQIKTLDELQSLIHLNGPKKIKMNGRDRGLLKETLKRLAVLSPDLKTIEQFSSLLDSQGRSTWIDLLLTRAGGVEQALELLHLPSLNRYEQKALVKNHLANILNFNPTLPQFNKLIQAVRKNSKLHSEIAAHAVGLARNQAEYKGVSRPSSFSRTAVFKKAKSDFLKRTGIELGAN